MSKQRAKKVPLGQLLVKPAAVAERMVQRLKGQPLSDVLAAQGEARYRLLQQPRAMAALQQQIWSDKAMQAFWSRYGMESDDFVCCLETCRQTGQPRRIWRLNRAKFGLPTRIYRLGEDITFSDRSDTIKKKSEGPKATKAASNGYKPT